MPTRSSDRRVKVQSWGPGLGIRLPREAVDQLNLKAGDRVNVHIEKAAIQLSKSRKVWTEEELLQGVTPDICGPDLLPERCGKELL